MQAVLHLCAGEEGEAGVALGLAESFQGKKRSEGFKPEKAFLGGLRCCGESDSHAGPGTWCFSLGSTGEMAGRGESTSILWR